jgi:hypothetical protein
LTSFTLHPLYFRETTHSIKVCPSLDDVIICVLYFSSVSTFWLVFYCQLQCWVYWQKVTGFLSIHSSDKQWKGMQCDVASFSRIKFYCQLISSRVVVQWEGMIAHIAGAKSCFAPIKHLFGAPLILNCYLFFSKRSSLYVHLYKHVVCPFWHLHNCCKYEKFILL